MAATLVVPVIIGHGMSPVAALFGAGIGGLTLTFGQVTITSIACALILGILVNILVNKARKNKG